MYVTFDLIFNILTTDKVDILIQFVGPKIACKRFSSFFWSLKLRHMMTRGEGWGRNFQECDTVPFADEIHSRKRKKRKYD